MRSIYNIPLRLAVLLTLLGIAIIITGGILAEGIRRVHLMAQRVQCDCQLRGLGIALHNYHADYHSYPKGTIMNPQLGWSSRLSWLVSISPYLEGGSPGGRIKKDEAWNSSFNLSQVQGPYPPYLCPGNEMKVDQQGIGLTHYVAISGIGDDAAESPLTDPRAGAFGYDRLTSLTDIHNGSSHTVMVIETATENGPWSQGGRATVRGLAAGAHPYLGPQGQFSSTHIPSLRNASPALTHALMVDGSVSPIADSIDPRVFESMVTINRNDK